MADEVDRGQQAGEVRTRADNQHVREPDKLVSLKDLRVPRQRLAEWRETRDAGPEVVDRAIDDALRHYVSGAQESARRPAGVRR
jgi:hypothetical protein